MSPCLPNAPRAILRSTTFTCLVWICCFKLLVAEVRQTCRPPALDETVMPRERCGVLRKVCVDQGNIISFDPDYAYGRENPSRGARLPAPLPYLTTWDGAWNIPGAINTDAIVGNQDRHRLLLRPATRLEPRPLLQQAALQLELSLQQPSDPSALLNNTSSSSPSPASPFSRCTLPVLLFTDWPFNYCEFFTNGATAADHLIRRMALLPDREATLVLVTPSGLGRLPFHSALLGHLSTKPLITLGELAAGAEAAGAGAETGAGAPAVEWSAEGVAVGCFERMVICKLEGSPQLPTLTAAAVLRHLTQPNMGGELPPDPLGFNTATTTTVSSSSASSALSTTTSVPDPTAGASSSTGSSSSSTADASSTLRVVIEARNSGVRGIRNLHQLVEACEGVSWPDGPFRRVSCRVLTTHDTPNLHGIARFRATVAAVRSADVLVTVHGAGSANALFMRAERSSDGPVGHSSSAPLLSGTSAAALLEIRPCGFGSGFTWWVDVHMAIQLPRSGDDVHFHAYNLEDPTQCTASSWELAIKAGNGGSNTRAGNGHRMRDQNLVVRPDGFFAMLRHVASMLRDPEKYGKAKAENQLHGYAMPSPGGDAAGWGSGTGFGGGQVGQGGAAAGQAGLGGMGLWGPSGGVLLGPLGVTNFTEHIRKGGQWLLPPG
ncbi:hypothetical protein Agub_g8000 [Astrephomene gubernaculifera]|uniref:Uncharacterized protein n=1 Tax=Astrephomene gubernaculifera TaxID=47775 RepID=A0AAD3DTM0_9CHLO|nr:hypothetical protein Agub_g8000 [Astrephomene gubernaculifera]